MFSCGTNICLTSLHSVGLSLLAYPNAGKLYSVYAQSLGSCKTSSHQNCRPIGIQIERQSEFDELICDCLICQNVTFLYFQLLVNILLSCQLLPVNAFLHIFLYFFLLCIVFDEFRRLLQLLSSGFFLPFSTGLIDPCETGSIRVHSMLSPDEQVKASGDVVQVWSFN